MDNLAIHFLNYDEQLVTQEAVNKLITIFVTIRFQMRGWLWMNMVKRTFSLWILRIDGWHLPLIHGTRMGLLICSSQLIRSMRTPKRMRL